MCHRIEDREWTIEAKERGEEIVEPEDMAPSFVEPGAPDVSLNREYQSATNSD